MGRGRGRSGGALHGGLRPQFSAKIYDLNGLVNGLSSSRQSRSQIELDGRVDEFGLARVRGELNPFAPADNTDVNVVFKNVDMVPTSPYAMKFAGYRIAEGKISLDLQYKVRDRLTAASTWGCRCRGQPRRSAVQLWGADLIQGEPQVADASAFYGKLIQRLSREQPLAADTLAQLGSQRAAAVLAALKEGGVDPARVAAGEPEWGLVRSRASRRSPTPAPSTAS